MCSESMVLPQEYLIWLAMNLVSVGKMQFGTTSSKHVHEIVKYGHVFNTCPSHGHVISIGAQRIPHSGRDSLSPFCGARAVRFSQALSNSSQRFSFEQSRHPPRPPLAVRLAEKDLNQLLQKRGLPLTLANVFA